ncbi:MAG: methyltransferase domain-containing protein [Planctomycetota bacterium]
MSNSLRQRVIEWFYPGLVSLGQSQFDSTVGFYSFVDHIMPRDCTLLDFGAGRGASFEDDELEHHATLWSMQKAGRRIGCDLDPVVEQNPALDECHVLSAEQDYAIPLGDESVDVVVADWVVEHLPEPTKSFQEIHRVLRSGGSLCLRTSNYWHYSYLLASVVADTPLEAWMLSKSQPNRQSIDVFPKLYRANTKRRLRRLLRTAGYDPAIVFTTEPTSAYMNFSLPTAIAGGVYHRIASAGALPRAVLLAFARKR